ncbi:MAG: hypothetical protein ACRDYA_22430 [Egibacteraceae bacterium]
MAPPIPEQFARFLEVAWDQDPDLGILLWLAMVTGARRITPSDEFLLISRNFVHRGSQVSEKDTKTHQARRVAINEVTTEILDEHHARCSQRAAGCGADLRPNGYIFSPTPDGAKPLMPDSVTGRLNRLPKKLSVK